MIRVRIIAESRVREQAIAELLANDERIEVIDTPAEFADVCVVTRASYRAPAASTVVLLSDESSVSLDTQIRAWLPMSVSAHELAAAVVAAAHDLTVLTREQARQRLPRSPRLNTHENGFVSENLTPREQQVLRMMADGLANKEIAGQLGISDHTAKFHVAQILAKLGAATRTEAVTLAIRRGLVPI
jgi:DNA-binding NarL/FixJ family response regulator